MALAPPCHSYIHPGLLSRVRVSGSAKATPPDLCPGHWTHTANRQRQHYSHNVTQDVKDDCILQYATVIYNWDIEAYKRLCTAASASLESMYMFVQPLLHFLILATKQLRSKRKNIQRMSVV